MTGRERLTAVLNRRRPDRLGWTCLADGNTLGALGEDLRGISYLDFCRRVGCDILLLEGWGTPHHFASPGFSWGPGVTGFYRQENGQDVSEWQTDTGTLTAAHKNGHPRKFPVTNIDELRIYRVMWEAACFEPRDDSETIKALDALVGEDGIVTRFWGPSAIPRLLEYDMGMENFYYLLADHPGEMAELIELMHQREIRAFEMLASGPCDVVTLVENTSTRYISPDIYRRFNGPHVADFVEIVHAAGKTALIHMCGHILNLLPLIKDTGLDGIHALTPPPVGDTPWQAALDVLGDNLIIIGAFDPNAFISGPVEEIAPALEALYTPPIRRSNVILGAFADGISVPLDRFLAVAAWFERNG